MFIDIKEDLCECHECGHVFTHIWTGADKPAVERFPIPCNECGAVAAYRVPDEDILSAE